MKKTLLLLLPMLLLASQNDTDKRIQALENELNALKKEVSYHQEDLDERIPIIEANEKKSILDRVNFTPEILLRADNFYYNNRKIEGENTSTSYDLAGNPTGEQRRDEFTKSFSPSASIRFRLNMDVDLDEIKFHGRMLYMNSSQSNERVCILSRDIKTGTAGSAFDVDRAYVDYTPNAASPYAFTFSFGILPTTAGTPMQYAQNKKRSSMFPALVFDMNTYGMIGTQKIANDTFIRIVLAKPYTLRPNFYTYQCNRENIDNANIIGLYGDTKFHFLGNSLLSFGANVLHDFRAHPYLGPDTSSKDSKILGTMLTFGLGIDIEKFMDTQTMIFAHTALSNPHPNGQKEDYQISDVQTGLTVAGTPGFTTSTYASGTMLNSNGYSLYLGTKYPISQTLNIGAEYNYGSKYWFSATQGAEDMFNKLATRGQVGEAYLSWQFHKYLNAKLSYMQIEESYTGSGGHFGEPAAKDATQYITSFALEAKF